MHGIVVVAASGGSGLRREAPPRADRLLVLDEPEPWAVGGYGHNNGVQSGPLSESRSTMKRFSIALGVLLSANLAHGQIPDPLSGIIAIP